MTRETLHGATALVTGADTRLGAAIAANLLQAGVRLATHVNDPAALAAQDPSAEVSFAAQATDEQAVTDGLRQVHEAFGALNILVTCHAQPVTGALLEQSNDAFWAHLDQQLSGSYLFAREAAPLLKSADWGRVVLLSSGWAVGAPGLAAVASAAAGVQVLCKTLSRELGPHGTTVNALAHAFTDSEWLTCDAQALALDEAQLREQIGQRVPAGCLGQPEQIAHTVRLLCQPVIGAAVAQTLQCNGGYFRHRT